MSLSPTFNAITLGATLVLLVGCSDHHDTVNAVDVIPIAERNAQAVAPVAEPITFDDEHLPKMSEMANSDTQESDAQETETGVTSETTTEETQPTTDN